MLAKFIVRDVVAQRAVDKVQNYT